MKNAYGVTVPPDASVWPLARLMLWLQQAVVGAVAGFCIGDAGVTTDTTILQAGMRVSQVRVEVRVFGQPVQEQVGLVNTEDGWWELHRARRTTVSLEQEFLVDGMIGAFVLLGVATSVGCSALLVRTARHGCDGYGARAAEDAR